MKKENYGIDVVDELNKLLQEEFDKIMEELPLGYDINNNAYHMGKGVMVNKENWDKYNEELLINPELKPFQFIVNSLKKEFK